MYISNVEKAQISYNHKDKIQKLFKNNIKGNLCIDHFSLNIFFGNGKSIFLSPTPEMAEALCKYDYVNDDSNYKPEIYKNFRLYPWRSVQQSETDNVINFIKEEKFGMRSGTMIVRNLGNGRYVMYSFATHRKDDADFPGQFYFLFNCKANHIAQLGDFMYQELLPEINQYGHKIGVEMPKLESFVPVSSADDFNLEQEEEMYHAIQKGTSVNMLNLIKKRNGPLLRLIDGGKIKS